MAFWEATRLHKLTNWAPAGFGPTLKGSARRDFILQWMVVGAVGIALGVFTLAVSSLPQQWALLSLLVVLFPFVAMIAGNVQRLLLGIIIIEIPIQLDVYLRYQEEAAALGAIGGVNLSLTTLCLAVLYALWLAELLAKKSTPRRPLVRLSLPLIAYLGAVMVSAIGARDTNLAGFQIFLLLQAFLLYLYVVHSVRSRQDILFVVTMLIIGLILQSLMMIGVRFVGHDISVGNISARIDSFSRVSGTFGSPNAAGSYLTLLLAPAMSVLLTRVRPGYKWLAALGFGLGSLALIFTLSRGSWIGFVVSISILCLLAWRRGWLSPTVPVIVVILALILFLPLQEVISVRLFGDDAGAAQSRIPLMRLAFRMIHDNPVLGVGANNFSIMIQRYATAEFGSEWLYTVHNQYLLLWAETGIVGLVAFIWLLLAILHRGWQSWKSADRFLSPIALGFTAAILGHMAHMFVDFFIQRPQVQLLWLIAALITAIHLESGKTRNAGESGAKNCVPSLTD